MVPRVDVGLDCVGVPARGVGVTVPEEQFKGYLYICICAILLRKFLRSIN